MAIEIEVVGNGTFAGARAAVEDYSVNEDSTPIEGSDTSGGVGQISFGVNEDESSEGTVLLMGDDVKLSDGVRGITIGKVTGLSVNNYLASVTADSRLGLLVADRQAQPMTDTLENVFLYYLGLAGVTSNIVVDDSIAGISVTVQGFKGNLWEFMKQLCIAYKVEMSLVSDNIVLRPLRQFNLVNINDTDPPSWSVSAGSLAQNVQISYYGNEYKPTAIVYPKDGWNADMQIYQVGAGEVLEVDIPVDVSLVSISQPVPQLNVDRFYSGSTSVYAVAGADGLPIPVAQWTATGGEIVATIGDDTKTIHLKITGSSIEQYAPYRIAVATSSSDYYSSLRLVGAGVHFTENTITIPTGVDPTKTAVEIGATVTNPFITTLSQAYDVGVLTAIKYGSPNQTIAVKSTQVNRRNDSTSTRYPTVGEVDAAYVGQNVATFDAAWNGTGKTVGDFDAFWYETVRYDFANQAFGNAAGARRKFRDAFYRVRSATISADIISYNAEKDTIVSDFEPLWAGKTVADFDAQWLGKTASDYELIPLWQD